MALAILTCIRLSPATLMTPAEGAALVGETLAANADNFINWEGGFQYGGAVTADGFFSAASLVPSSSMWFRQLDRYLAEYYTSLVPCTEMYPYGPATTSRGCGSALLSPTRTIPWNASCLGTVGDRLGVFPIVYLARFLSSTTHTRDPRDLEIATRAAANYLAPYPNVLKDGTITRAGGCCKPDPRPIFVWADDQFMGLALLARLAACTSCGLSRALRRQYATTVARAQLGFTSHLRDPIDGLIFHGAKVSGNGVPDDHSCCKWGRANGWGLLAHVEVMRALESFPGHPDIAAVKKGLANALEATVRVQDPDTGLYHQVMNESSTFLETSGTAMATAALATALHSEWINSTDVLVTAVRKGWAGIASRIAKNGTVAGVCMGTGIERSKEAYNGRGTDFYQSAPGAVGSVLLAAAAVARLEVF